MSSPISNYSVCNGIYPPLGIDRKGSNKCWAIALFQMIVRSFEDREIPDSFPVLKKYVSIYREEQKAGKKISSLTKDQIAESFSYPPGRERQEDVNDILRYLIDDMKLLAAVPVQVSTQKPNSEFIITNDETMPLIFPLKNTTGKKKLSIETLIEGYFREKNIDGNHFKEIRFKEPPKHLFFEFTTYGDRPSVFSRMYSDITRKKNSLLKLRFIQTRMYKFDSIKRSKIYTPFKKIFHVTDMAIEWVRKTYDTRFCDHSVRDLKQKIILADKIDLVEGRDLVWGQFSKKYVLDSIDQLPYWSAKAGHYISYIKESDQYWYECNGKSITKLTKQIPTKSPSLAHYRLIE